MTNRGSISDSLVLDDSKEGVFIAGITDNLVAAKSGLQTGDELVAATIHLDKLNKDDVMKVLKVLKPYEDSMEVLTKKDLDVLDGNDSLGLGLAETLSGKDSLLVTSLEAPAVSLGGLDGKIDAVQGLGGKLRGPTVNGDIPRLSLKKPSTAVDGTLNGPSVGLTGPDIKTDLGSNFTVPDVSVSAPHLNTPDASLDIDRPKIKGGNFKAPKFTMPHFNLPQIRTPKATLDTSGDVNVPSLSGNIGSPDLKLSAPQGDLKGADLDLNGPIVDLNGPGVNLETPNTDIRKGPTVKGPNANLKGDLTAPDMSLSTPKIDGDVSAPDLDINLPKADIETPDLKVQTPDIGIDKPSGKFHWPHTKWGKPKLHGPKADLDLDTNLNAPDVDVSVPQVEADINARDVDFNLPKANLKGPDLDVKSPNIDTSHGINWPHLKWKKGKLHHPKAELDINAEHNTPNFNLSGPDVEGDINGPSAELNLPKTDLVVQTPQINAEPTKLTWPHKKWKLPKLHGPKAQLETPNVDADICAPDVDLTLPSGDLDVEGPEVPSGKLRFPTLKKPTFNISGPKVNTPDVDLDAPKADFDVYPPNADIKGRSIKWPTLKKPKWSVSGPKVDGPDLNADVSAPDLNLSVPEMDLPDGELNGPKVDDKAPGIDIDAPSGKFKWFKTPKLGTLKVPKTDLDADMKVPDVNLGAPDVHLSAPIDTSDLNVTMPNADVNGPSVDLNGPDLNVDGNWKLPKFNLPKLKGLNLKGSDLDADLKAPNIDASLDLPDADVDLPKADLNLPDLSMSAPKIDADLDAGLDYEGPEANWKLPKVKLPKLKGLNLKGLDLDADLKAPNIDASLDIPDANVDLPKADLKVPDLSMSAPKIDGGLDAGLDYDGPEAIWKLPKFKLPKLKGLNLKGPDLDDDLKAPDLDANLDLPDADVDLYKADLDLPDLSVSAPKIDDLIAPDVDVPKAGIDIETPDIDAPGGKFKLPKMKMPKFNLLAPKVKEPNIDVDTNVKSSDFSLDTKMPNADLTVPDLSLKTPDLNASAPNLDAGIDLPGIDLPGINLDKPTVNLPQTELQVRDFDLKPSNIGLSSPNIDGDLSTPNIDAKLPQAHLEQPNVTLESPDLDMNFPKVDLSSPHVDIPGANISAPNVDLKVPGEIEGPEVNVKAPNASLEKPKKSHFKFPKFWTGSKSKSFDNDIEGNLEDGSGIESDVLNEFEVPAFKFHTLPRNSIDFLGGLGEAFSLSRQNSEERDYVISKGVRLPVLNATNSDGEKINIMERLKMAKEKPSSANVTPTEEKTEIDLKVADSGPDLSLVRGGTFKVEQPEASLCFVAPDISSTDENDKFSVGLDNMLVLNKQA